MGNANKDVVIINNTPHTPRKRGGEIASEENYSLALELWRAICAETGLAFIVDNCTANGARKVAARYLDTGILSPDEVEKAMRRLSHIITHNERSRHYTLNALGNNISRYLEVDRAKQATPSAKTILWDFTCDTCDATAAGYYPEHAQVNPSPCTRPGCDGMMIPKKG